MLKKFSRYYHTLKHLKPIQIRYQLWYRLRNSFFPVRYPEGVQEPKFQKLKLAPFPDQYTHYLGDNHFQFLNLDQTFKEEINWNYVGHGKLWAYHLNYFDYLHQSEMDWETGKVLIESFLQDPQNRPEGMEPYPISLRTINWVKFLTVHKKYPQEIVDSLNAQYRILTKKLEYHLLGNHLLENGFSLLFGAVFFQDKKLIQLTRKILRIQLKEQILDDGAHFERSPMYHVILLQRALDGYNLLINNKHELQDIEVQLHKVIQKMVNWLHKIMFSNRDMPMLNDSTGGQALKPDVVLSYAKDLGFVAEKLKLSDSGYRKLKSGEFELIADVGEVGPAYQPGHAHSDTLSFVLYHQGEPVVVDRGISTYEKNGIREEERSTSSHNTVIINKKEQTDVWGGFRVGKRAYPLVIEESESLLKASHTGYENIGARHIREFCVAEDNVVVVDYIYGEQKEVVGYLHFHPGIKLEKKKEGRFLLNNSILRIENAISIQIEEYFYCIGFNKFKKAKRLKIIFSDELKMRFTE